MTIKKKQKTKQNSEITLDILSTGEIRFTREQKSECRDLLLYIMSNIVDKNKIIEIQTFLSEADNRELILGQEVLCG